MIRQEFGSWPAVRSSALLVVLVGLLLVPGVSRAQDAMAARLLESGDRLARDSKLDQARDTWQDVVARYPDAPAAPAALWVWRCRRPRLRRQRVRQGRASGLPKSPQRGRRCG